MAWVAAAGAALSFISANNKSKQDTKDRKEMSATGAMYDRENTQFDKELDYYYTQLDRQDKMRGLDEFRKFSTVKNYMPNYHDDNPDVVVPEKPVFNEGQYAPPPPKKKEKFSWTKKLIQPFYRVGEFE